MTVEGLCHCSSSFSIIRIRNTVMAHWSEPGRSGFLKKPYIDLHVCTAERLMLLLLVMAVHNNSNR